MEAESTCGFCLQPLAPMAAMLARGRRRSPFVERSGPLLGQHGPGTVDGTLVLARWRVHVPGLDHVHGRGDHRGDEAGAERRDEVAGQVVCGIETRNPEGMRSSVPSASRGLCNHPSTPRAGTH